MNTAPKIGDFVIYAEKSVSIGIHSIVTAGDIGVKYPAVQSFGPQLFVGDFVQMDAKHNLLGPSVFLGAHSQVGDVQTNALQNAGATTLGHVAPFPGSAMPPAPLGVPLSSGGVDVTVAQHQTIPLTAGTYGNLSVADHAVVTFGPGAYSFSGFTVGQHCQLIGDASGVTVSVNGVFNVAGWTSMAPVSPATADKFFITVNAMDGPNMTPPAATLSQHDQVTALVAAPNGTLSVADHVQVVGALAGFDVALSDHVLVTFQGGFPANAQQGTQLLGGYINAPASSSPIVGAVPPSTPIPLGIGLPERNAQQLQVFMRHASDPTSPTYRQYMATSDFAVNHGALPKDYGALTTWAQAAFATTNTYPNNLFIDIVGTAAEIEQALHVNLLYALRPDGSQFYEMDREPSVNLLPTVLGIDGTDNYYRPIGGAGTGGTGCGGTGAYQPVDLRAAYVGGCLNLTGSGQSIGIMAFTPFNPPEYGTFEVNTGITALVPTPPPIQIIAVNGGLSNGLNSTTDTEPDYDIEMAVAMAPEAQIYVFSGATISSIMQSMAGRRDINQFSASYYYTMNCNQIAVAQTAADQLAAFGQSFYQISGDEGAYDPNFNNTCVQTEEAIPTGNRAIQDLTLVGGTQLSTSGPGGAWTGETVWETANATTCTTSNCVGSGGGILSAPFCNYGSGVPLPWYQTGIANATNGASTTNRNVPDVAMAATGLYAVQTNTGVSPPTAGQVICNGQGTSFAAPMWAGFNALMNQEAQDFLGQKPVGFTAPAFYALYTLAPGAYKTAFHDVQSGNNATGCFAGYSAGVGYDLATGLGSPSCGLINEVGALASPPELQVTLSEVLYGTTGFNVGNCGQPAGGSNVHIDNGTLVFNCTPTVNNGVISSQPVSYTQQIGCGDNHAGLVTISCFGSGQAGDASLNGSVSLSLTSSCDPGQNGQNVPSSDNNSGNVQTWNFGGILPGAAQQNSLSSCDLFGNACAADPCNFNTLAAGNILAASVGGF